jgi:predicted nuclease of predicted toxin-antitoxin system
MPNFRRRWPGGLHPNLANRLRPSVTLACITPRNTQIFEAARQAGVMVLTKDVDFVDLVERLGPPPQVIWLTCGNTSNAALQRLLRQAFPQALTLLGQGEALVEIAEP